ncbi:unnamed protein product [Ectocarpus fasciculatus]
MRRSCSECGRKKRSCDGQRPCGRCVVSGSDCTYTERRRHVHQPRRQQDRDDVDVKGVLLHHTTGALGSSAVLPWKRCRLSASPATGLVGMQENTFLSDFFGCNGFLPLATPSQIRETMVKIMSPHASSQQSVCGDDCDEGGHYFEAAAQGGDLTKPSAGNHLPMDPSACTFWCAVALGALAKGTPFESVASYAQRAQEALAKSNFDPADAEVAKAWVILAYLYGFMGDMERFEKYLALSDSFLRSSIEEGSTDTLPVGFAEILKFKEFANASCGEWPLESFSVQEDNPPPQLSVVATEAELYRYVAQSCRAFEKAVYTTATEQSAPGGDNMCDSEPHGGQDGVRPSLKDFMAEDISNAMGLLLANGSSIDFEPLEEAVDRRPSIRGGIGALFINGTLVFEKAAKGDLHATLEKIGRSIEVLERYPGLCRCMIGCHMTHMMLICLAAAGGSGARAMYDRVRGAYNSCRPSGYLPVPPFEEWRGVDAFCNDLYCRAIEGLVSSGHMRAFSAPPVDGIDGCDRIRDTGSATDEDVLHGRGHTQHEIPPAFNNIPGTVVGAAPVWSISGGAEGDMGSLPEHTNPSASSPTPSSHACRQAEPILSLPETREEDGKTAHMDEDDVAEEDWLDAARAISDAAETV